MRKELKEIALTLKSTLSLIWSVILIQLSDEPRIWQRRDRFGNIYWYVYDPINNRSITLNSEQEVRQWLEERFYR